MLRLTRSMLALVLASSILVAGASGCGGETSSAGNCVEHGDCDRGFYCTTEGVCGQQTCTRTAMCPQGDLVCDDGYCTLECTVDAAAGSAQACPAGQHCAAGVCEDNVVDPSDVSGPGDGGTAPGGDAKDPGDDVPVVEDIPVAAPMAPCSVCEDDAACGGDMTCEQLGTTRNCFAPCENDGGCDPGWICYPITNEGSVCIPSAYQCSAGCLAAGCPAGQTCDQLEGSATHGQCIDVIAECETCTGYDWQCGLGRRCVLTLTGMQFCVPECDGAVCPDWASCQEKGGPGGAGVMVCKPGNASCCGPDCAVDCDPACSGVLGQCRNGMCVQCTEDAHCTGTGETCNSTTYSCVGGLCSTTPSTPFEFEGSCVQCLTDEHCEGGGCDPATHTCEGGDPCNGLCEPPYPACAIINGVPSCVACTDDTHCDGGACVVAEYRCEGATAANCNQDCVVQGCPATTQFNLACDPASGCCYDQGGLCDNVQAFCREDTGSQCMSIFEIFMGGAIPGGGGGIPGMPPMEGFAGGMCTCDAGGSMLCGLLPNNPICADVPQCHEGGTCMGLGTLIQILMSLGGGGGGAPLVMGDFCTALAR